jgi:hypothetical protein
MDERHYVQAQQFVVVQHPAMDGHSRTHLQADLRRRDLKE